METTTDSPKMAQRSPIARFFRWLFSWRILKRALFVFAVLATLGALVYVMDSLRGQRAWTKYRAQLEAQGERLDWNDFIPPAVSDDKNFAASPFFVLLLEQGEKSPAYKKRWPEDFSRAAANVNKFQKKEANDVSRKPVDLIAWQAAFSELKTGEPFPQPPTEDAEGVKKAATAVLDSLKIYDSVLEELHQAAARPSSRFNLQYDIANPFALLLPHLASMKGVASVLQLRASAELALGQNEKACQDVLLMFRLGESLENEPLLISYLVHAATFKISADTLWRGLAQNQWSDAQLASLQSRFQQADWLAGLGKTLRAERAFSLRFFDYLRKKPSELGQLDENDTKPLQIFYTLSPKGWLCLEQVNYTRLFQEYIRSAPKDKSQQLDLSEWSQMEHKLGERLKGGGLRAFMKHDILSRLLLPALGKMGYRAAEMQTIADQAALACALERYRRAKGEYPDQLSALAPQFIDKVPHDVVTGEPLLYKRTANGKFILYSVGPDEMDNGGLVARKQNSTEPHDWVWQP